MSVLGIHPFDIINNNGSSMETISIGCSHSYYFYQQLNTSTKQTLTTPNKQIIPSIPREKLKLPKNSSLSPIRNQKFKPKQQIEPETSNVASVKKRPYPLITAFSSPALHFNHKRHRKVSFDEKVVVVCTVFDEDEDEILETKNKARRHSTGETQPKSILCATSTSTITPTPLFTKKITKSLKQFKNRLSFI